MIVKELIEKLQKCDPNATVCVEAYRDPLATDVKEYDGIIEGNKLVYIADTFDYLDESYNDDDEDDEPWPYEEDEYTPSSTRGDYSPSNPWDAPGMKISDFI